MALTFKPPARELISALSAIAERTDRDGRPWCPPKDALAIRQAVIDRSEDLAALFWQLPRFVRLAALCSRRAYFDLPYRAVPVLRGTSFKSAIEVAVRGRSLSLDRVLTNASGVVLLEAAMLAEGGRAYQISYHQMPRLGAFLDVLHNTLGYATVEKILAPILSVGGEPGPAVEVARALRSTFNAWLEPRLESAHRRQQAKVIHADLARHGALRPERIDDAVLFAFWSERATHWSQRIVDGQGDEKRNAEKAAQDEGFRLYRSAVTAVLAYRQALIDAETERSLSQADAEIPEHLLDAGNESGSNSTRLGAPHGQNPLAELLAASGDEVKWLTDKEVELLSTRFGAPSSPASADEPNRAEAEDASNELDALVHGTPIDPRFALTLLRLDLFGRAQAQIVGRMRKRMTPDAALTTVVSALPETGYAGIAAAYADVRDQLHTEGLAALEILARAGAPMFLLLVDHFGGAELRKALVSDASKPRPRPLLALVASRESDDDLAGDETAGSSAEVVSLARRAAASFTTPELAEGPIKALAEASRQSRRKVNRQGFRKQDESTSSGRAALARSVPTVLQLLVDIGRLCLRLERVARQEQFEADLERFAAVLKLIYAPDAAVEVGARAT